MCGLSTNAALSYFLPNATLTEMTTIGQKLAAENAVLQTFIIVLGEDNLNAVEALVWTCIALVYTSLRVCLAAAHTRLELDSAAEVERLLWGVAVVTGLFVLASGWVFWSVGIWLLLIMHYEGFDIILQCCGLLARKRSIGQEIVLMGAAHAVTLVQWLHLLVTYTSFLGFPIQFILFYKLARVFQKLQEDTWRYRGYHHSTKLLLQKCPPLTGAELESVGDERCCMCWEALREGSCSRLPCRHVHHV